MQRSALIRGPAIVQTTLGTVCTLYTRGDITVPLEPNWSPVMTSMYGQVDKVITDRVFKFGLTLWGAWENLDLIFPSYLLAPQAGASIFGNADTPWSILGRNGDKIAFANCQITRLANLYLGVNQDKFAADVEVTAILANNTAPETANAYYTISTGNAYTDGVNGIFTKANYKRSRVTGNWGNGGIAGFTAFACQKGAAISWNVDARPLVCDGFGTVDFTIGENIMMASATVIPVQNTMAQLEAQAQAQGTALGSLLSNLAADLQLSEAAGAPVITLKSAAISKHGYVFGIEPLRQGPITWETTRGFAAGVPNAVATAA